MPSRRAARRMRAEELRTELGIVEAAIGQAVGPRPTDAALAAVRAGAQPEQQPKQK